MNAIREALQGKKTWVVGLCTLTSTTVCLLAGGGIITFGEWAMLNTIVLLHLTCHANTTRSKG